VTPAGESPPPLGVMSGIFETDEGRTLRRSGKPPEQGGFDVASMFDGSPTVTFRWHFYSSC